MRCSKEVPLRILPTVKRFGNRLRNNLSSVFAQLPARRCSPTKCCTTELRLKFAPAAPIRQLLPRRSLFRENPAMSQRLLREPHELCERCDRLKRLDHLRQARRKAARLEVPQ